MELKKLIETLKKKNSLIREEKKISEDVWTNNR